MAMVVIAGQSNALGYGNTGPAPYVADPLTYIWDNEHDWWVQMQPGVNTGTPANPTDWGPEVAFAQAFRTAHPSEILTIVKSVKGSTSLAEGPGLDWSPDSADEMFDLTTERVAAARGVFGDAAPAVDALLWMQGETDATDGLAAGAYQTNLETFLAHARAAWNLEDVILGRIGEAGAWSHDVRVAQWALDQQDPHMVSFRTLDYMMQPDGLHYAADGQLALGQGFYDHWIP